MNPIRFYFLSSLLLKSSIQLKRSDAEFIKFSEDGKEWNPQKIEKKQTSMETSLELARLTEAYKADKDHDLLSRLSYMSDYLDESPLSSRSEVLGAFEMEEGFWITFCTIKRLKSKTPAKTAIFPSSIRPSLTNPFGSYSCLYRSLDSFYK